MQLPVPLIAIALASGKCRPAQRQICQDRDFEAVELYPKVKYLESRDIVLVS